jgi:hypothetical protein
MRDTGISSTGVMVRSLWSSESLLGWCICFWKKGYKACKNKEVISDRIVIAYVYVMTLCIQVAKWK